LEIHISQIIFLDASACLRKNGSMLCSFMFLLTVILNVVADIFFFFAPVHMNYFFAGSANTSVQTFGNMQIYIMWI